MPLTIDGVLRTFRKIVIPAMLSHFRSKKAIFKPLKRIAPLAETAAIQRRFRVAKI